MATITATTTADKYMHETNPVRHMEQVAEKASLPVVVAYVERDGIWTAHISLKGRPLADFVRGLVDNQILDPEEAEGRIMAGQYSIELDDVYDGRIVADYVWLFANGAAQISGVSTRRGLGNYRNFDTILHQFAKEEFSTAYVLMAIWRLSSELSDVHRSSRGLAPADPELFDQVRVARGTARREHMKARIRYERELRREILTETGHEEEQSVRGLKTRRGAARAFETLITVQRDLTYIVGALSSVETVLNAILDDTTYGRNKPKMGPAATRLSEEIHTARTTAEDVRRDIDARSQRSFKEQVLAEPEILP